MSRRPTRRLPDAVASGATGIGKFDIQQFARRLHEIMTEKGMSQSDLAREIWGEYTDANGRVTARNRNNISMYLRGRTYPEPQNLRRIAEVLGVPIERLAPDVVASTVDREDPAVRMTAITGHPDKVHLEVNTLTSFAVAAKIIAMLAAEDDSLGAKDKAKN